jgi:hypothetical protein
MNHDEFQKAWIRVVAKAWSDEHFKQRLLDDPKTVLREHGIEMPAGVDVKLVEDSGKTVHLILPVRPEELSLDELDEVAGGYWDLTGRKPDPNKGSGNGIAEGVWWYGGFYYRGLVDPRQ